MSESTHVTLTVGLAITLVGGGGGILIWVGQLMNRVSQLEKSIARFEGKIDKIWEKLSEQ